MADQTNTQSELSRAAFKATHGRDVSDPTFLTGPQVAQRYQKSHVTIWRWTRDPDLGFPKPIQINRHNFWRLAELQEWEDALEKLETEQRKAK